MVLALVVGWLVYRTNISIWKITTVALAITLLSVWLGIRLPTLELTLGTWSVLLLLYSLTASVDPVWVLLQPRDYLNNLLL